MTIYGSKYAHCYVRQTGYHKFIEKMQVIEENKALPCLSQHFMLVYYDYNFPSLLTSGTCSH